MLLSAEIPIANLNKLYPYIDFPFIINIYKDIPEYQKFYIKACKNAKVSFLDNGMFESLEHKMDYDMSLNNIKKGFDLFHPTYIFSEEKWDDYLYTVEKAKEFKKYFNGKTKIASCVHGNSFSNFIKCYLDLIKISDCISFSHMFPFHKEIVDSVPAVKNENIDIERTNVRIYIVSYLLNKFPPNKPIHLLGCNNPIELPYLAFKHPIIETADTSSPILNGINRIKYEGAYLKNGKIHQGKDYIFKEFKIDLEIEKCIIFNIGFLKGKLNKNIY